jgi:hypothetical protein
MAEKDARGWSVYLHIISVCLKDSKIWNDARIKFIIQFPRNGAQTKHCQPPSSIHFRPFNGS